MHRQAKGLPQAVLSFRHGEEVVASSELAPLPLRIVLAQPNETIDGLTGHWKM